MTTPKAVNDLERRRAQARKTAVLVALAAVVVYVLFWVGGVMRA